MLVIDIGEAVFASLFMWLGILALVAGVLAVRDPVRSWVSVLLLSAAGGVAIAAAQVIVLMHGR